MEQGQQGDGAPELIDDAGDLGIVFEKAWAKPVINALGLELEDQLVDDVAGDDVAEFVADGGDELPFGINHFDEAAIEIDKAAGNGAGVDHVRVHQLDGVGKIGTLGSLGEVLHDAAEIVVN